MDREMCIQAVKCFGNVAIDYLPDILEPFGKYGRVIGSLVKMVKEGVVAVNNELEAKKDKQMAFEKIKQEAFEELKEISSKLKNPEYVDCVVFLCNKKVVLNEEQKEILRAVLLQEYISGETESLEIIDIFIRQYMGETIDVNSVDDCEIADTYISFTFNPYAEFPYDKEDMDLVMGALNRLLEVDIFDYYIVDGHDKNE